MVEEKMTKLNKYEDDLLSYFEENDPVSVNNVEEEIYQAKIAAGRYLKKTKNINIRLTEGDILKVKRKSAELNIPYQTILASVIHQFATGKIKVAM